MLSLYCYSFFPICERCGVLLGAVKQMLPSNSEKVHFVIDLTGASAALNSRA